MDPRGHRRRRRVAFVAAVAALSGALVVAASAAPTGAATGTDWSTYGFNLHRSGENTAETAIGVANVSTLHKLWSAQLGGVIVGQAMVAAGVVIAGKAHDVVYVGDEQGRFFAIDEKSGKTLWKHKLPTKTIAGCGDIQDGVFGIGGAATLNRATNTVYIAAGDGAVHAYDLATGAEQAGWPVTGVFDPKQTTSYGAITADPAWHSLYVQSAGHCDFAPYHGALTQVAIAKRKVVHVFRPSGTFDGGGIWGAGGASYDPATHHLFVATGNALTNPESFGQSDQVVELDKNLAVVGSNYPGLTGNDVDFGATPILYKAPGCPLQVSAENKSGVLVTYTAGALSAGPTQRIQVAGPNDETFIGMPAYSASRHVLYVASSSDSAPYTRGLVAFTVGADCKLTDRWNKTLGPNKTPMSPPTVANGVVYFGDGYGGTEHALDATTGQVLWSSGNDLGGSVYAAPIVVNGKLLVGTWGGRLVAFGPA